MAGRCFSITLVLLLSLIATASAQKWSNVEGLLKGGEKEFHSLVDPLAHMTLLSYIATNGSYYRKEAKEMEVPGFQLEDSLSKDPSMGVRAKVFVGKQDSDPVVIAFRGSDMGMKSEGSLSDLCFDSVLLASELGVDQSAPFCSGFQMDYFSQAQEIVNNTLNEFGTRRVIVTGHSLGCALAGMMSAQFHQNVTGVCFGCPGILNYTSERTGIDRTRLKDIKNFYTLSEAQDPIALSGVISGSDIGKKFLWSSPALPSCNICCQEMTNGTQIDLITNKFCTDCFQRRHEFRALYTNTIIVPGSKANYAKDNKVILKCDKKEFPQLEGGQIGMVVLFIVVLFTSLVGVVSAAVAYRSKQASFSRYLELGQSKP